MEAYPSAHNDNNIPLAYSSCSAATEGMKTQCTNIDQMLKKALRPNAGCGRVWRSRSPRQHLSGQ
eukprot:9499840-Pyramimonas_sp.AAC.1